MHIFESNVVYNLVIEAKSLSADKLPPNITFSYKKLSHSGDGREDEISVSSDALTTSTTGF